MCLPAKRMMTSSTCRRPKRIFATYYRVAFYGAQFGELNGKEYIYRENQITQLSEIALRLESMYKKRFGDVNIIRDASKEATAKLDPKKAYFQVTHVEPYITEEEKGVRVSSFERNHNISRFYFEVLIGKPSVAEREIDRIILTVEDGFAFPYIKKRSFLLVGRLSTSCLCSGC